MTRAHLREVDLRHRTVRLRTLEVAEPLDPLWLDQTLWHYRFHHPQAVHLILEVDGRPLGVRRRTDVLIA